MTKKTKYDVEYFFILVFFLSVPLNEDVGEVKGRSSFSLSPTLTLKALLIKSEKTTKSYNGNVRKLLLNSVLDIKITT